MKTTGIIEDGGSEGLPLRHMEAFLGHLRAARYAERTLSNKRWILTAFDKWMRAKNIATDQLDESAVTAFVQRSDDAPASRVRFELAVLRLLLAYLRGAALAPLPALGDETEIEHLHGRYVEYLRQDCGLAENSVLVYAPFVRDFLNHQHDDDGHVLPDAFDAMTIRSHLLTRGKGRSDEYMRLMAVALRSFCHFLFLRGDTPRDLAESVPRVSKCRQSSVPRFLTPEQEQAILMATDRSTPVGRRDYAILLLLARLGLRAGEISSLELDDILWRSGELVIHGKGKMVERLPLLSDVGEALAIYLHEDRGTSTSRRVFLRMWAPRVGLAGPSAIGCIARLAFARAGFHPACRSGAHLFRHGLATTMIRRGASMAEIAEVLRHRSQGSSAIYAKVAFEELRGVARPWPTMGGVR